MKRVGVSEEKVFTSRILLTPDSFGYTEIYSYIVSTENISKHLFVYLNDEKSIKIEHIRQLQQDLANAPLDAETTRVVVIHPLEKILHVAQQALLKLLEEPPIRTQIFLVGNSLHGLTPTILSRCQVVRVADSSDNRSQDLNQRNFWDEIENATPEEMIRVFSQAPEKKEEALIWIRQQLAHRPQQPSEKTTKLIEALGLAYEALISNVSPKLTWARIVAKVSK